MTCRILLVAACAVVLGTSSLAAQQSALRPRPSSLFVPPVVPTDSVPSHETYWKTGALVGGIPSAIFGGALGLGLCGMDDSAGGGSSCAGAAIGMGLLLGGIGAITGALIGGQFEKP